MQLALALDGKRGAGRKGSGRISHAKREHKKAHPIHVTMKVLPGVASLRGQRLGKLICRYFREVLGRRADFRVVAFSVQGNHIHLIAEAENAQALSRGRAWRRALPARSTTAWAAAASCGATATTPKS